MSDARIPCGKRFGLDPVVVPLAHGHPIPEPVDFPIVPTLELSESRAEARLGGRHVDTRAATPLLHLRNGGREVARERALALLTIGVNLSSCGTDPDVSHVVAVDVIVVETAAVVVVGKAQKVMP